MSTHPYIPLYVDDYEAATAHLTIEEDGVYNRLLRLCWRTPGCSLPDDEAWIARKIRLSADDFERIAKPVLEEFFKPLRGRLVQRRLKDEYDNISRKKSARKQAGKKGGDAKALKQQGKSASIATVLPAHTRAFPEPEPEPEPEKKESGVLPFGNPLPTRGTRLKPDWTPSADNLAFAVTQGFTAERAERIAAAFRDFWVAQPGAKGVKTDWSATWRNWIRREAERRLGGRPQVAPKRQSFV